MHKTPYCYYPSCLEYLLPVSTNMPAKYTFVKTDSTFHLVIDLLQKAHAYYAL